MAEYNEKIYNEMRQRAREFTKDKVERKLYEALMKTFEISHTTESMEGSVSMTA